MQENIRLLNHHESNFCDWGKHKMEMQRIWLIETEPVSWICARCIVTTLEEAV